MPIALKEIPKAPLLPEEVEALSNKTFDYADRERVSMREADRKIREDFWDKYDRNNLAEVNRVFGANLETRDPYFVPGTLTVGYGDFTFKEKVFEVAKAGRRGVVAIMKVPGVALKAIGEAGITRKELADLKKTQGFFSGRDRRRAWYFESPMGKISRSAADMYRRAGNKYIEAVNGLIMEESLESQAIRQQSFISAPLYRTAIAVGESAPSYGLAVAATLTSGNPNIGLFVLGTTTASSSYDNLRQQGVDPDLALIGATIEGSIEMLTEKIPMDILMKGGGRPFLIRALRLGTAESFQELFAQLGQNYTEAVVKDVDPEDYSTVLQAARQEWSIITQGWEDAMAAGFVMGGGAAMFSPTPARFGRTAEEMRAEYGFNPRNMGEILSLTEQVKQKVKDVEKLIEPPPEAVVAAPVAVAEPEAVEVARPAAEAVTEPELKPAPIKIKELNAFKLGMRAAFQLNDGSVIETGFIHALPENIKESDIAEVGFTRPDTKAFITRKQAETLTGIDEGIELQQFSEEAADLPAKELPENAAELVAGGEISKPIVVKAPAVEAVTAPIEEIVVPTEAVAVTEPIKEIGKGEIKPRGTSVSVMAQAIENEMAEENKALYDEIPTYRAMNMAEQARKALALIESDLEKAKRVAFYKEPAPPDLFPENVFSALRTYAKMTTDIDLLMDLALNEDVVREHTIMGKRIKSLDTDQDYADPISAIREVVETRKQEMIRKGKDVSALEAKFRDLQTELDRVTKARTEFTKRAARTYGTKNKLVAREEYDSIIARRKEEAVQLRHDPRLGAVYVPNAQDFVDIGKIGLFHLEAMGRDFAKWSYQMTKDFGDWITPHLQDEYDKALKQAKAEGVEIKESKRLIAKKKRLATVTGKLEAKIEERDLAKIPRIPIELDEEGQRLQNEYDLAREKYKAAQAVANIITEEEVRIIAQLAKDVAERKAVMEKSERRKEDKPATVTELEYGVAMSMFLEYVNDLKAEANKRTLMEVLKGYLSNPVDFISDFAGTLKAAKASLDNSFHLRQGLPTFLKAITGHIPSAKIWWKTFTKSWKMMWDTLRKRKVMQGLFAEMVSDPDYDLLKKSKVALNVIEEEIPVDIPSRIPLVGMLFRMGENAFVGSSRYMRYQVAKQYIKIWRKSGKQLNKRELESIGRLANSQTGRGEIASKSKKPGLLNNVFWSPRNLRAYVDILTLHLFDRNFSAFARKQAAINLVRYVSGTAMILAIADWIDDDSVTKDSNSADFGKIKIGNTRFSVGGGMVILVILASRLITRKYTSSVTGKTKPIDTRKFGALGGKDLVFNFFENKLSPAAALALSVIDQQTWDGDKLTIPQMVDDALTPLIIQNVFETGSAEDSANVLAALMAEAMGVNVQTYRDSKKQKSKKRTKI